MYILFVDFVSVSCHQHFIYNHFKYLHILCFVFSHQMWIILIAVILVIIIIIVGKFTLLYVSCSISTVFTPSFYALTLINRFQYKQFIPNNVSHVGRLPLFIGLHNVILFIEKNCYYRNIICHSF